MFVDFFRCQSIWGTETPDQPPPCGLPWVFSASKGELEACFDGAGDGASGEESGSCYEPPSSCMHHLNLFPKEKKELKRK